jgi:excisionase family DNA binding protein
MHETKRSTIAGQDNMAEVSLGLLSGAIESKNLALKQFFDNQILTVKEVAKLLKLSTKTIYKRVSHGEIPHKKIGDEIRFLLPELMSWMKGQDYV